MLLLAWIVASGLFYFSEGKPCPEKTQPHKSRCDVYFKCVIPPSSNTYLWILVQCDQGLIFEPKLRMCILPGENWECNLEEMNGISEFENDENIVLGPVAVDAKDKVLSRSLDPQEGSAVTTENEEIDDDVKESDYIVVDDSESSLVSDRDLESSGDGEGSDYILLDTLSPERKTNDESPDLDEQSSTAKIDPNLTAHLQRLTQLIDGLKQTYQNKDTASSDLRPDQLNAFLAHYNIKAQLDSIDPAAEEPSQGLDQNKQNQSMEVEFSTSTSSPLDPETKVILTNQSPNNFNSYPKDGYSNSQIVVNKPEGSVLFTLGDKPMDSPSVDHRYVPKISEDTLKTVLQLSKQMLDSQDIRRVLPTSAYFPQLVQPIYLSPPLPQFANNAFQQFDKQTYFSPPTRPDKSGPTIINNNVNVSPPDENHDQVDSYGQSLYPPFPSYQQSSDTEPDVQDHSLENRYENNQLVTARPNKGYFEYQSTTTTTPRPYVSDTGSTLFNYYTPNPYLDETNINSVFQMEKYPTFNVGSYSGRPTPVKAHKRPSEFFQNSYHSSSSGGKYHQPNQQSILQLFPTHIDPSKVIIRPNSQKLESMEQEIVNANDHEPAEEDEDDQNSYSSSNGNDDDGNNQSETYNRYNTNKQITASQLAQYVGQLTGSKAPQQFYGNDGGGGGSTAAFQQNEDESQLGGAYPGNLLTYDLFKGNLPLSVSYDNFKPDSNNCPVGVRQPNVTECTRYYVCSRENGQVMQYTCPSFTAFNPQTRICDAQFYAFCHPSPVITHYSISQNQRLQLEAIKAIHNAKRIQALQSQNLASLYLSSTTPAPSSMSQQFSSEMLSSILQNAIDSNANSNKDSSYSSSVSQQPNTYMSSSAGAMRKRKYYCKEGDKVADQTSIYNYFVCFKNPNGVMKGHKMKCSEGLLFCPMTSMCTLPRKCS